MIITIVTETFAPDINGVAMTLGRLVSGLVDKDHKLQLVCTDSEDRDIATLPTGIDYIPVKGIPIPRYSEAKFGLPSASVLKSLWTEQRPDAIYVATEGPLGRSAINIAKKMGIPSLSGFHTNFQSYSHHYGVGVIAWLVERYLVSHHNKSNMTLTPTIGQKHKLLDMGIKNVSVLSRGVDTELFNPQKRSLSLRMSWGAANDHEPVILYVGRIAAEKNLNLAVKAYEMMLRQNKQVKFVLVGDGPLLGKMRKENPDFIFAGMRKDEELAKYYASSDIFIFPSLTETFGNVVLEAMASGLGVVAFDYAAANMHIKHGVNGMSANINSKYEFISHACDYVTDLQLLENNKHQAAQYAGKQSWTQVNTEFEGMLKDQAYKSLNKFPLDDSIRSHA